MSTSADPEVVIAGASAGAGRATAVAFAARGARIGLLARGGDGLAGTHGELDDLARSRSWQFRATTHRGWLTLAGAGIATALIASLARHGG